MEDPQTNDPTQRKWLADVSQLLQAVNPTSHHITSVLALLSASVTQGSALPPYMQLPRPYQLSQRLEKLDKGILDARHVQEPGYSAYAVIQVASSLVTDDLRRLVELVKDLVGEVDFSFRVGVGSEISSEGSEEGRSLGERKGKND
jgi:hypothetical protein